MRTLLGFAFIALLHGQELAFDVASIKPIESDRSTDRFLMTAGRTLRSSGNTYALISWAYQAEDIRLEGLPEWFSYQYYVITAKSEGAEPLSADQFRQMLRKLLTDRFRLKVHPETLETAVYALVLDKSGTKLKESAPGAARSEQRFEGRLEATQYEMARLAHRLQQELDRKVIDLTGLTGLYDVKLEWAPVQNSLAASDSTHRRSSPPSGPNSDSNWKHAKFQLKC